MANSILQLTSVELQQVVEQELAENPALEVPDDDPCDNCDQPKTLCIDCPFRKQAVSSDESDLSIYELEQPIDFAADADDSEGDFISNIRAEITLHDHLTTLLRAALSPNHWLVGEYIISNINDSGYLEGSVEEFAHEMGKDIDEVADVLAVIQTFDPPGVGARDLRECLKLQLERLEEDDKGNPIALAMVRDFWQEMLAGKVGRIARRLRVSAKEIMAAIEFVKKQLNPYPGNSFRPPYQTDADDFSSSVRPDVVVRRTPSGYELEIMGHDQYVLNISSTYRQMYEDIKNGGANKYSKRGQAAHCRVRGTRRSVHPQHQPAPKDAAADNKVDSRVPTGLPGDLVKSIPPASDTYANRPNAQPARIHRQPSDREQIRPTAQRGGRPVRLLLRRISLRQGPDRRADIGWRTKPPH